MARALRTVITNFSSGELNPLLATRTDVNSYFQGAKQCHNFALLAEGGLMRRPGTTNLASLPAESRLIPFIFSDDEVAIIALSDGRMDVYNVAGTVLTSNYTTNCNWSTAQLFELISNCLYQIWEGEEVHDAMDYSMKDKLTFIDSLNHEQFEKIQNFFETMPTLKHEVHITNPKTKKKSTVTLSGMNDFF